MSFFAAAFDPKTVLLSSISLLRKKKKKKNHPELDHGEAVWGLGLLYLVVGTDKGECSGKQKNVKGLSIF